MRLSRIDQHTNDEPCAKQRALLGIFSSRFSSVSRVVRSALPIFTVSPFRFSIVFLATRKSRALDLIAFDEKSTFYFFALF
jgi:hypothetical protein